MRDEMRHSVGCMSGLAVTLFGSGLTLTGLITAIFSAETGFILAGFGIVILAAARPF